MDRAPETPIRAIETQYKGYRFRSRLEARWAVFLDAIGWRWEYEPEGFELSDGTRYLPDFLLRAGKRADGFRPDVPMLWLEIKPVRPTDEEICKAQLLCVDTRVDVAFGIGIPGLLTVGILPCFYRVSLKENEDDPPTEKSDLSLDYYCFQKWGRPGYAMGALDEVFRTETEAACNHARGARFEHGERGGIPA